MKGEAVGGLCVRLFLGCEAGFMFAHKKASLCIESL